MKALATLNKSLIIIKDPNNQYLYDSLRDSTIQRFEYSIDGFWKFLKFYIQENEKVDLETSSPRMILRQAETMSIIDKTTYDILIDALADRNLTSHIYNEETADTIVNNIQLYYNTMISILEKIPLNTK